MPNSMITTVLEIEREAEAILDLAGKDAQKIISDAKETREQAAKAARDAAARDIAALEAEAARRREAIGKELRAAGEAELAAVRNTPTAVIDGGAAFILDALAGK